MKFFSVQKMRQLAMMMFIISLLVLSMGANARPIGGLVYISSVSAPSSVRVGYTTTVTVNIAGSGILPAGGTIQRSYNNGPWTTVKSFTPNFGNNYVYVSVGSSIGTVKFRATIDSVTWVESNNVNVYGIPADAQLIDYSFVYQRLVDGSYVTTDSTKGNIDRIRFSFAVKNKGDIGGNIAAQISIGSYDDPTGYEAITESSATDANDLVIPASNPVYFSAGQTKTITVDLPWTFMAQDGAHMSGVLSRYALTSGLWKLNYVKFSDQAGGETYSLNYPFTIQDAGFCEENTKTLYVLVGYNSGSQFDGEIIDLVNAMNTWKLTLVYDETTAVQKTLFEWFGVKLKFHYFEMSTQPTTDTSIVKPHLYDIQKGREEIGSHSDLRFVNAIDPWVRERYYFDGVENQPQKKNHGFDTFWALFDDAIWTRSDGSGDELGAFLEGQIYDEHYNNIGIDLHDMEYGVLHVHDQRIFIATLFHEFLHLIGAEDKYNANGDPDFVEPPIIVQSLSIMYSQKNYESCDTSSYTGCNINIFQDNFDNIENGLGLFRF